MCVKTISTCEMAADFLTKSINGIQNTKGNAQVQLVDLMVAHEAE